MTTYDLTVINTDENKDFLVKLNRDGDLTTVFQISGTTGSATFSSLNILPVVTSASTYTIDDSTPGTIIFTSFVGTAVTLSSSISQGKTFDLYNSGFNNVTVTAGSTIAILITGARARFIAKNASPSSSTDWLVVPLKHERFFGTTTASSVSVTNAAYSNFSTNISLTFTAPYTGDYRISASVAAAPPTVASATWGLRINATGSPTSLWLPQGTSSQFSTGSLSSPPQLGFVKLERIDNLTVNSSYTYNLQGRSSSSGTVTLRGDQMPLSIIAEML